MTGCPLSPIVAARIRSGEAAEAAEWARQREAARIEAADKLQLARQQDQQYETHFGHTARELQLARQEAASSARDPGAELGSPSNPELMIDWRPLRYRDEIASTAAVDRAMFERAAARVTDDRLAVRSQRHRRMQLMRNRAELPDRWPGELLEQWQSG
jgi:hypothetical protein